MWSRILVLTTKTKPFALSYENLFNPFSLSPYWVSPIHAHSHIRSKSESLCEGSVSLGGQTNGLKFWNSHLLISFHRNRWKINYNHSFQSMIINITEISPEGICLFHLGMMKVCKISKFLFSLGYFLYISICPYLYTQIKEQYAHFYLK